MVQTVKRYHLPFLIVLTSLMLCGFEADGDGVCKKSEIPPGFVPVREFFSPECLSGLSRKISVEPNAWDIERTQENTAICISESLVVARSLGSLMECEGFHFFGCPKNSFRILRSPADCAAAALAGREGVTVRCANARGFDENKYAVVAETDLPNCPGASPSAYLLREVSPHESDTLIHCSGIDANLPQNAVVTAHLDREVCGPALEVRPRGLLRFGPFHVDRSGKNAERLRFLPADANSYFFEVCADSPVPNHYQKVHSGERPVRFWSDECGEVGAEIITWHHEIRKGGAN